MKRGSTPTFTFEIPFDVNMIRNLFVTIKQTFRTETIQVDKTMEQCEMQDNQISCILTQEDTLKFKQNRNASVQLRVLTTGNNSLVSDVFTVRIDELLKEGVIE